MIALMIVVGGVMAVVATTITIVATLATMIVNVVHMDAVMIMAHAELIGMPHPAVKIAIAAVVMIAAVGMSTMVVIADAQAILLRMANRHHQEIAETRTVEVEPLTTALTIGIPVDKVSQLNLLRCGALCQITYPRLSATNGLKIDHISV